MMRALFAGVSGLRNHQTRLDVIGNNISNVNTIGFKASRVTFEEAFAQSVRGASRPTATRGGANPIQIGVGMNIASIDQNFTQGNLESTGSNTDIAIQGTGFFVLSDGNSQFYTRAGNFSLDANGRLVSPNNGNAVQGVLADSSGVLPTGVSLTDIVLPLGQVSAAQATTEITLRGNLDTRVDPLGTVLRTAASVYAVEQTTSNGGFGSDINGLLATGNANQQIIGMTPSGTTVTVTDGTTARTYTYVSQDTGPGDTAFTSLSDLIAEINNDYTTMTAALNNATGAVEFTAGAAPIALNVSSSNSTLSAAFASVNGALAAATTVGSDQFSHIAVATDLITNLRDATGTSLGATVGSTLLVDGDIGGASVTQGTVAVGAASTYQDLLNQIDTTLSLTNTTGSQIDAGTGALIVTGDGGTANEVSGLNIRVQGGSAPFDGIFDSRPNNYLETQIATDVEHQLATSVFDSLGNQHVVTLTFTKDPTSINRWTWQAAVSAPATLVGGSAGVATFDDSGRLQSFSYNGGGSSLQFTPNAGAAALVDMAINVGTFGDIDGLSQFGSPSNAVVSSQDGHGMGILQDFAIDQDGIVTGIFDNGQSQTLARIAVAAFSNPSGLVRRGDGMYDVSPNSGDAIVGFVGTTNQSQLTPGAIEGSNVDLSKEFTSMIIAQRGFQANARVITTADEMLSELVSLKR